MCARSKLYRQENPLLQSPLLKEEVEKLFREKYKIEMKAEELQDYFSYEFKKGGHNIHRKNPEEVSKAIVRYIETISVIERNKNALNSKL